MMKFTIITIIIIEMHVYQRVLKNINPSFFSINSGMCNNI